jgi:ABC-2 type transport system ATP-binding protein
MIEIHGLTRYFGPIPALRGIDLRVGAGEVMGFLGQNGAGKSTTLRILAGCLAASSGTASVAGFDIFEQSLEARESLGYLPENVPLYPEMTVTEYLSFVGALHGLTRRTLPPRLAIVVERCGLGDVRGRLIGRLSRGYRQRVGLAQALLHDPPVLILDEPTVGLDPRQIVEIRELIRSLAGSHTVLLSTHILAEVSMVCTRVAIIHRGRIVAEDTLEHLTGGVRGGERLIVDVEGDAERIADRLRTVAGVSAVSRSAGVRESVRLLVETTPGNELFARATRRAVSGAVVAMGGGLLELRPERETLEDVFVRLTAGEAAPEGAPVP